MSYEIANESDGLHGAVSRDRRPDPPHGGHLLSSRNVGRERRAERSMAGSAPDPS
jgi:hypothetical protein